MYVVLFWFERPPPCASTPRPRSAECESDQPPSYVMSTQIDLLASEAGLTRITAEIKDIMCELQAMKYVSRQLIGSRRSDQKYYNHGKTKATAWMDAVSVYRVFQHAWDHDTWKHLLAMDESPTLRTQGESEQSSASVVVATGAGHVCTTSELKIVVDELPATKYVIKQLIWSRRSDQEFYNKGKSEDAAWMEDISVYQTFQYALDHTEWNHLPRLDQAPAQSAEGAFEQPPSSGTSTRLELVIHYIMHELHALKYVIKQLIWSRRLDQEYYNSKTSPDIAWREVASVDLTFQYACDHNMWKTLPQLAPAEVSPK